MSIAASTDSDCVNSIFQRDWWLDAVAPGQWHYVDVINGTELLARMPVVVTKRMGMRFIQMPRLTYTLGPWLSQSGRKTTKRISQEKEWLNQIIDQLPPFDYFCQNMHSSLSNTLPFQWRGFECSNMYTYVVQDLTDLDMVWQNYHEATRRQIRKAERTVRVVNDLGLELVWHTSRQSFNRRNRDPHYDFDLLTRIDDACVAKNSREMFFAIEPSGLVHAALYIVWDNNSAYYLIGGANPEKRNSGAISLLMHEAIRHASRVTKRFDFMGCNIEPFEAFKRNFGGQLTAHTKVRGFSRRFNILYKLKQLGAHAR